MYRLIWCIALWLSAVSFGYGQSTTVLLAQPGNTFQARSSDPLTLPDGEGGMFIVYRSIRKTDTVPNLYFQHVTAAGEKQPNPDGGAVVAASPYLQKYHRLTTDGAGGIFIIWCEEETPLRTVIKAQRLNARGEHYWRGGGLRVCKTESDQTYPAITTDSSGGVYVFWEDERGALTGKDIYGQHLNATGERLWGGYGRAIHRSFGPQQNIQAGLNRSREVLLVWEDQKVARHWRIVGQKVDKYGYLYWGMHGLTVSQLRRNSCRNPVMVHDGFDGLICIYEALGRATSSKDLYIVRMSMSGDPVFHESLCEYEYEQKNARLFNLGDEVVAFWEDYRNGDADLMAQKMKVLQGKIVWDSLGVAVCNVFGNQYNYHVNYDGRNEFLVAWEDDRDGGKDLYYQRISADSGHILGYFTGIELSLARARQYDVSIAPGPAGGIWSCYVDEQADYHAQIVCQTANAADSLQYDKRGLSLNDAHKEVDMTLDNPVMTPGGNTDFYVAWDDGRHDEGDIYLQRLDSTGAPLWRTGGVAVTTAPGAQNLPRLLPVDGGVYVAWLDRRDNDDDIYIQYIDTSGRTHWQWNGVPVSTQKKTQNNIKMTEGPGGTLIMTWTDARNFSNTGFDIYLQILDADGTAQLRPDGQPLVTDATYQTFQQHFTDTNGNSRVVWMDERLGFYNIFSLTFDAKGAVNTSVREQPFFKEAAHQRFPQLAATPDHQLYVLWNDDRFGNMRTRIVVQRYDSIMTSPFGPDGLVVCAEGTRQHGGRMLVDSDTTMIIYWFDQRNESASNTNIYAQRVHLPTGKLMWKPEGVRVAAHLHKHNYVSADVTGSGTVLFGWSEMKSENQHKVYAAELDLECGEVLASLELSRAPGDQLFPYVATCSGTRIIAWLEKTGTPRLMLHTYR